MADCSLIYSRLYTLDHRRRLIAGGDEAMATTRHRRGRLVTFTSWRNRLLLSGKIGEVGPPVNGLSFFTVPYSHLRYSTVILLCEASRLPPATTRFDDNEEEATQRPRRNNAQGQCSHQGLLPTRRAGVYRVKRCGSRHECFCFFISGRAGL